MPEITVSPAAHIDLFAMRDYFAIEVGDRELADRFIKATQVTFEKLASNPGLGRQRKFRRWPQADLRSSRVNGFPNHLVFYRPVFDGVEIVRVLYGTRDLDSLFGG